MKRPLMAKHRLKAFLSLVELVFDAVGVVVDVISPPSASQTSYSDHPLLAPKMQ